MLEEKVNLQLWVKVRKDWRDSVQCHEEFQPQAAEVPFLEPVLPQSGAPAGRLPCPRQKATDDKKPHPDRVYGRERAGGIP